jgi:hypothetical protein
VQLFLEQPANGAGKLAPILAETANLYSEPAVNEACQHAFTNPQNAAEERADREYKVATPRFLKEVFGLETASK